MNNVAITINTEYAYHQNIYGRGIGVAVLDTGIYPHNDLIKKHLSIKAFYDCVLNRSSTYDDNGHGTHVASIIGGSGFCSSGRYRGIAPMCNLIGVKILNCQGNGSVANVYAGIEWVIKNKDKYNIRIINISVGAVSSGSNEDQKLIRCVEDAWDNGLIVLTAAGNLGPKPNTITIPGISKKIITVGTVEDSMPSIVNNISKNSSSGCGPTLECIVKPEVLAPGSNIISCSNTRYGYVKKSGTSMATPVVSGVLALVLEKKPSLCNKEIKQLLYESSSDLKKDKNRQGWGMINLPALLDLI